MDNTLTERPISQEVAIAPTAQMVVGSASEQLTQLNAAISGPSAEMSQDNVAATAVVDHYVVQEGNVPADQAATGKDATSVAGDALKRLRSRSLTSSDGDASDWQPAGDEDENDEEPVTKAASGKGRKIATPKKTPLRSSVLPVENSTNGAGDRRARPASAEQGSANKRPKFETKVRQRRAALTFETQNNSDDAK